jgi:hypothetical protein
MDVVVDSTQLVLELLLCSLQISRRLDSGSLLNREHICYITMMLIILISSQRMTRRRQELGTSCLEFLWTQISE